MAVTVNGRPYMACSAGLTKLGTALMAQVLQKKNEKHSHTDGSLRNAIGCSARALPAASGAGCDQAPRQSSSAARLQTMMASTISAHKAPHRQALPHEPLASPIPALNTGAMADPREPLMPCTEKPWPRRGADTRLFRMVRSTGWNEALPSPASAAASHKLAYPCAAAATNADAARHDNAPNSMGRAPTRSTTKPANAWPTPETTKNTDTSRPSSE